MIKSSFYKHNPLRFALLTTMIILAALSRIVPHMPNFSPLLSMGLFAAAFFPKKWEAYLIPLAATLLSDLILNNWVYGTGKFMLLYDGWYWQYGAYAVIITLGIYLFKKSVRIENIIAGVLLSSVLFFSISNFGSWVVLPYPKTWLGLAEAYAAGVPFFKGTVLGNVFYSALLFGGYSIFNKTILTKKLLA